jgi:hypothetical protein
MSSWCSNSRTVLALAGGALSLCLMSPSARAGDKIEFSMPDAALEAPQVEREDKEPVTAASQQVPDPVDEVYPAKYEQGSSEVLIVVAPKWKDVKTSDPAFPDDQDDDTDADSRYDNPDSTQRPVNNATTKWDTQRGRNPDAESIFSDRKSDEATSQDSPRGRLEAAEAADKPDYRKDERYGRRTPDANEDSAWSHSFSHHGASHLERMREGQFVPFYQEAQPANEQPNSSARLPGAADDLRRDYTSPPGGADYHSPTDDLRDRASDESAGGSQRFHYDEARTASQSPDAYSRQKPPPASQSQVQAQPAILPFPKKPGDLLR